VNVFHCRFFDQYVLYLSSPSGRWWANSSFHLHKWEFFTHNRDTTFCSSKPSKGGLRNTHLDRPAHAVSLSVMGPARWHSVARLVSLEAARAAPQEDAAAIWHYSRLSTRLSRSTGRGSEPKLSRAATFPWSIKLRGKTMCSRTALHESLTALSSLQSNH
jgi:hypothetical protein